MRYKYDIPKDITKYYYHIFKDAKKKKKILKSYSNTMRK